MRPTAADGARVAAALVAAVVLLAAGCPRAGTGGGAPPTAPPTSVAPTSPKAAPAGAGGGETKPMGPGVKVRYYGQSCFLVTDSTGKRVATDPYGDGVGYPPLSLAADVCLVSHDHFDHNNTKAVSGSPEVLRTAGAHEARGLPCLGVTALHHEAGEHSERGTVVMFRWVMDGVALLHVGDLATSLDAEQLKALGNVDVLLLPVGGYYTIDAQKALGVARSLKAKVVIPMHYRTEANAAKLSVLAPVDDFLKVLPNSWLVTRLDLNEVGIPQSELEKADAPVRVIVLNYQ